MKRVELIFDEANESEILMILRQSQIEHYTRHHNVTGHGSSGRKLNNAIGPGINNTIILYLEDGQVPPLLRLVRRFKEIAHEGGGHAGTRCAVSNLEEFL